MAGVPHPIPSRTRPLSPLALMVLRLKARESKSLPGQLKLAKQNRHLPEQTCQLAGETNEARLCRAFFVPEIQTLLKFLPALFWALPISAICLAYGSDMTEFPVSRRFDGGDAPLFIFVDHASNAIPPAYDDLGLPEDVLATHIGWDIGAWRARLGAGQAFAGQRRCSASSRGC